MTQFEILDDNGVIDSGDEDAMRQQFQRYVDQQDPLDFTGDLKLVQVLAVHR